MPTVFIQCASDLLGRTTTGGPSTSTCMAFQHNPALAQIGFRYVIPGHTGQDQVSYFSMKKFSFIFSVKSICAPLNALPKSIVKLDICCVIIAGCVSFL
jgi:hypothetical protein